MKKTPEREAIASLYNVSKYYGNFAALKDININLYGGEVHMLLGENGAGKSTLVSLLTGVNHPDDGELVIRNQRYPHITPHRARELGINTVLQNPGLAPTMTVAENFDLGREATIVGGIIRKAQIRRNARDAMNRLGISLNLNARIDTLGKAEQQLLEIIRALGGNPGVLILDEPTASLSHSETSHLFEVVRSIRDQNWAVLYISHRMEEIEKIGDVVTILRDGSCVGFHQLKNITNDQLITEMVGTKLDSFFPTVRHNPTNPVLETTNLSSDGAIDRITVTANRGEIVGVGGLVGCGKEGLGRAIFGLQAIKGGKIKIEGQVVDKITPAEMLRRGIVYLPQDRIGETLAANLSVSDNVALEALGDCNFTSYGVIRYKKLRILVNNLLEKLNIIPFLPNKKVQEFSGGNQQKVVLARALSRTRKLYIFEEPTAGVDVGARADFYEQLGRLCKEGHSIILITSDLQELVNISHRIYVIYEGKCTGILEGKEISEKNVISCAFGNISSSVNNGEVY